MKISNINTISNYIDRLITENIKKFRFLERGTDEKAAYQDTVIAAIKQELSEAFEEMADHKTYQFLGDERTFNAENIMRLIEELIVSDLSVGLAEHGKLEELNKETPHQTLLTVYIALARYANERRAMIKNELDMAVKELVEKK